MTHQSVADDQYGQLWRRLKEIARRVDEGSVPFDTTMRSLQLVVEGKFEASVNPTYPVTVNYGLTLAEMIEAGRYDWLNLNLNIFKEHFPMKGEGTKEVVTELVHFNRYVVSQEVLRELDKRSFCPATIEELLSFGARYHKLQRQFPIVALGSIRRRLVRRYVSGLWGASDGRGLGIRWFGSLWDGRHRFLAVRK
jgi:hypothetical protein